MRAVKANKEYLIDESQSKMYQNAGFDIVDGDGKVVAYGKGKTVPYSEYVALKKEIAALTTEMESLKAERTTAKKTEKDTKATKENAEKAGE